MSLTITGLSKTYPNGVQALKNISLTIGNNMFGLLGPNGAGKSSLMRTIATLQDPDSGSIDLDGVNVLTQKDAVRKTLGYLPQEFGVYPRMSAIDMRNHLAIYEEEKISQEHEPFTIVVDRQPTRTGIDPYNKLIDRIADDNMIGVTHE